MHLFKTLAQFNHILSFLIVTDINLSKNKAIVWLLINQCNFAVYCKAGKLLGL
jgi:hypothetical protein